MTLGETELNLEIMTFHRVLDRIEFPIISTNMEIPETVQYHEINQTGVIIMSYTPEESKELPLGMTSGTFFVKNMTEALNEQINILKSSNATRKFVFIASGCAGISVAKKIAERVADLDVVLSGCSRTMQWNDGEAPDGIEIDSPYPLEVTNAVGRKVLIAHTYGTPRFLGKLHLEIDDNGHIQSHKGTMIYLSHEIQEDEKMKETIKQLDSVEVAQSRVFLNGHCSMWECNLGNLIADAFVQYKANVFKGKRFWTDTPIGLMAAKNIKANIGVAAQENIILVEDLLHVIRPHQELVSIEVKGDALRKTIVQYIEKATVSNGIFLQVSGLHIRYDRNKNPKRRLVTLMARCYQCTIPKYYHVINNRKYKIITTGDVYHGLLGHTHLANGSQVLKWENITDLLVIQRYLMQTKFVRMGTNERIRILMKKSSTVRCLWDWGSLFIVILASIVNKIVLIA